MTTNSNIQQAQGSNIYCGPAVLSSITGIPTDRIAELINEVRHHPYWYEVKGAYIEELIATLDKIGGYKTEKLPFLTNGSLFFALTTVRKDGFYIVTLPSHFVLIEKAGSERYICDNNIKTPMRAEGSARLNQKVLQAYHVEKVGPHTYTGREQPIPPKLTKELLPVSNKPSQLETAKELLKKYIGEHNSRSEGNIDGYLICDCQVCLEAREFLKGEMR